jgi:hypothetical protein
VDVFPWLKTEEQRFLPTVKSVCAALRSVHPKVALTLEASPAILQYWRQPLAE